MSILLRTVGKSKGFPLGEGDNVFGDSSGTDITIITVASNLSTAETVRDNYDIANVGWKDSYLNKELNIVLYYENLGNTYIQYQRNINGVWVNNQLPIVALKGTDISYLFTSTSERDLFFSSNKNRILLQTGLPTLVNRNNVATPYYWSGGNSPATYDSSLFKVALDGMNTYRIYESEDLEDVIGYSNGVITVPTGVSLTLVLTSSTIISSVRFVLEGTAELRITTELANGLWIYDGTDTFLSGRGIRASLYNIILFSSDISTFIDTKGLTLNVNESAIAGFNTLGKMVGTGLSSLGTNNSFISQFDFGLDLENMITFVNSLVITSSTLTGDVFNINNNSLFPIISTFDGIGSQLNSSNNLFNINPVASNDVSIQITSTNTAGGEGIFNTSGGKKGTFTSVINSSTSIDIIGVQDDGNGLCEFLLDNISPDTVFVGQIVTISGYISNTNYNGTFRVISKPTADSFVVEVDFNSNESFGVVSSDVITLTDIGTTLIEGDTLYISTTGSLKYDGGATVFNKQTDSFQINRGYSTDASGTWDTSPLNQSNPNILASGNIGFMDSTVRAETVLTGNTLFTDIPSQGAKVIINADSWVGNAEERLKTGVEGNTLYSGLEPVAIKVDGNVLLEPNNSTKSLSCQFARQFAERVPCTFNSVNESVTTSTPHNLSVNDNITFNDTEGVLDISLRTDIVYYVSSIISPTEFTLKYFSLGPLIPLNGGSSGNTTFSLVGLYGSTPVAPIAANNPRTLVPQGLENIERGDKTLLTITNEDNDTNILVTDAYYRTFK